VASRRKFNRAEEPEAAAESVSAYLTQIVEQEYLIKAFCFRESTH
jgi:hypothetical protein